MGMLRISLQAWMPTEAARDQISAFAREAIQISYSNKTSSFLYVDRKTKPTPQLKAHKAPVKRSSRL